MTVLRRRAPALLTVLLLAAWGSEAVPAPVARADLPALVEALRSGDAVAAGRAAEALVAVPQGSAIAVLPLLADGDAAVRTRALEVLGSLEHWWASRDEGAEVVRRLAEGLAGAGTSELQTRLWLIGWAGPHATIAATAIGEVLRTAEGKVLAAAASAASRLGTGGRVLSPIFLDRLLPCRGIEPDEPARAVANALAVVGPASEEEVKRIAASLAGAPGRWRVLLLLVLGWWGESATAAIPDIVALPGEIVGGVRKEALDALGRIPGGGLVAMRATVAEWGDIHRFAWIARPGSTAREALAWLLDTAAHGTPHLRDGAVTALGRLPRDLSPRIAEALTAALGDDFGSARASAVAALFGPKSFGPTAAVPNGAALLDRALCDPDPDVRRAAVQAVGAAAEGTHHLAQAARIAPLLTDPDSDIRFWAGTRLLDIGVAPDDCLPAVRENLRSEERLVRLGALRAAQALGPAAWPALSELLDMCRDPDLGDLAILAVGTTLVLDDRIREVLLAVVRARPAWSANCALRALGRRGAFLEETARGLALIDPRDIDLALLAGATADPEGLAAWTLAHRKTLGIDGSQRGLAALGPTGLPGVVTLAAEKGGAAVTLARQAAREIGAAGVPALRGVARAAPAPEAALALRILAEIAPAGEVETFAGALGAADASVRAAAAAGLAAAFRAGAEAGDLRAAIAARLDDEPVVRAAALSALAAAGRPPPGVVEKARAALGDADPFVRVAAAEAVWALADDAPMALETLGAVFAFRAPVIVWFSRPGRRTPPTEDEYPPEAKLWNAAAGVLMRMGPAAAPLAETVGWAALRYGEEALFEALIAMGEGAAPAGPLLTRLAATRVVVAVASEGPGGTAGLGATLERALLVLGIPIPAPLDPAGPDQTMIEETMPLHEGGR